MAIEDSEYIGVSELAAAVGETLADFAEIDRRMKSGATEIPTERTIRFYLEKGLLPKPSKRLGQTLVFGRVHLLTLLVIKKLQADGVPLGLIPGILKKSGKTEAQLEELLGASSKPKGYLDDGIPVTDLAMSRRQTTFRSTEHEAPPQTGSTNDASADSESSQTRTKVDRSIVEPREAKPDDPAAMPFAQAPPASEAKSYLRSLLTRSRASTDLPQSTQSEIDSAPEVMFSRAALPMSASPPQPTQWTRHETAPGVEINISDDYEPPSDEQGKAKLLEMIRRVLGI